MIGFPNCKINLGLYVTERRDDGYHDLETIFYPVKGLHDALEIIPSAKTGLYLGGKSIDGSKEDNIVWKAYHLLQKDFPQLVRPLEIHLLKSIPMGAGLGGGSADGSVMLQLMNKQFSLGLNDETLAAYALQLGSDCPFFIHNTPQFARGRGEIMEPVSIDIDNFSLQLLCPDVHVSTSKAFGMITPKPAAFDLKELPGVPVDEWKNYLQNDFEAPVFTQYPELANIKQQLYNQGALYASMSGSGSSIFGIFNKGQKAVITSKLNFSSYYLTAQ
jgi:4-diphosphocytidyl-2-C-methyl-D-erythritol kinase